MMIERKRSDWSEEPSGFVLFLDAPRRPLVVTISGYLEAAVSWTTTTTQPGTTSKSLAVRPKHAGLGFAIASFSIARHRRAGVYKSRARGRFLGHEIHEAVAPARLTMEKLKRSETT